MTSNELKYAILWHWRFKKRAKYLATEMFAQSGNIRDVLIIDEKNNCIEFECKISASDFKADFKKAKHSWYAFGTSGSSRYAFTPMQFYFVFPESLDVDESLLDEYPKYGVIRVCEKQKKPEYIRGNFCEHPIHITKYAEFLTEKNDKEFREKYCEMIVPKFILRMTSEIVNLHAKQIHVHGDDL